MILATDVAFGYTAIELFIGALIIIAIVLVGFKLLGFLK